MLAGPYPQNAQNLPAVRRQRVPNRFNNGRQFIGSVPINKDELVIIDRDELPFHDLPAADELVRADFDVVHRAPALLLDRCEALAVQHAELHVRLPGRRCRRRREADGDADEPEAH